MQVGDRVTHAYTGSWTGTVRRTFVTRLKRERVTVLWDGRLEPSTHDADLIRKVETCEIVGREQSSHESKR